MKYTRPTDRESTASWESIWLGAMDCTFFRGGGSSNSGMDIDGNVKPKKAKIGSILHQHSSGHGYAPTDYYEFHMPHTWLHYASSMGGTPRERRTISQRQFLNTWGRR